MKTYFFLQYKILNRKFRKFGLSPILAYILLVCFFIICSSLLFSRTESAHYIFIGIALIYLLQTNKTTKNDFLKTIFLTKEYWCIRFLENTTIALPFILFLCYKGFFVYGLVLFTLAILTIFLKYKIKTNFAIPTPFSRHPFEFTIEFRATFLVFPFLIFLCIKAIQVDNFNLGIFSLCATTLICMSFYNKPETNYFVWIFNNFSAKQFLLMKVKIAFKNYALLSLPILVLLLSFFFENYAIILATYLLSLCYLATMIFAKYANSPEQIGFIDSLILISGILFFPLLIFIIPHFYSKALQQLKPILK